MDDIHDRQWSNGKFSKIREQKKRAHNPYKSSDILQIEERNNDKESCNVNASVNADVPMKTKQIIKARTRRVVRINLIKSELKEGYIPRIDVGNKDVFLREGVVINDNNTCKMVAINTSEHDVAIEDDARELIPFETEPEFLEETDIKDTGSLTIWDPYRNLCTIKKYLHEFFGGRIPDRTLTFTNIKV
ncbi:hypothetical protein TSAR_003878 [Trichomalopsis sarcophagae]|uniref:Uncharacterized protein n=1 Tax=Trichomalopsis sarcophagae TaxID=543379 RepID=A0A232F3Y4_9HYME|nr:hypothetical protein TSAR_003878 [Trichomalopsis sarcophagae]